MCVERVRCIFFCKADTRDGESLCMKNCFVESYFDRNHFLHCLNLVKENKYSCLKFLNKSTTISHHNFFFQSAKVENKRL